MNTYQVNTLSLAGSQSAKFYPDLKGGEIIPFEDLSNITTQGIIEFCQPIKKGSDSATRFNQLFGSIPRLSSSLRRSRFIHPALLSSPSSIIARVKRSDKSASKRNCTTILSFWFSLVDIGVHPYIFDLLNGNVHHCIPFSKAMPRSASTLTGHLITNDTVTLLAEGALIIPLFDTNGTITGAQTIKPDGDKQLLRDSVKSGSYYPVNEPVNVSTVIIAEGLAIAPLLSAQRRVDQRLAELENRFDRTTQAVGGTERSMMSLSKVAASLAGYLSVAMIGAYADAWTSLNNKLANSIKLGESQADVMKRIFDITASFRTS